MKVLCGIETYCVDKAKKKIVDSYDVIEVKELTEESRLFLSTVSFFSDKDKYIIYCPDDVKSINSIDESWVKETNVVCVIYGNLKIDVQKKGIEVVRYDKLTQGQLRAFIVHNLPNLKADVLNKFIDLSGYLTDENINLYSIESEIKKLRCFDEVTIDILMDSIGVPDISGDAFKEGNLIVNNNWEEATKNARACSSGQELAFIGALQRFFRIGWKYNYYQKSEIGYGVKIEPCLAANALEILDNAREAIITGELPGNVALLRAVVKILDDRRRLNG